MSGVTKETCSCPSEHGTSTAVLSRVRPRQWLPPCSEANGPIHIQYTISSRDTTMLARSALRQKWYYGHAVIGMPPGGWVGFLALAKHYCAVGC